ncbi:hypothetical protein EXIGLDRAFT_673417 [Exidia glandulosa HHB12029]|uniref:25S rRNA adenine-N(1) methyltransferase n=1 Tax=Exidia glandulosa HHB12029 TaxID=1314781 RepID=A0A165IYG8_EXIGL|nr:hypothetical protein EXIGLDRAFT_673417 [Exidia glandulosa HHB12029]
MSRKRKVPVTVKDAARKRSSIAHGATSAKPEASRAVIRRFHVLLKRKAQLERAALSQDAAELSAVQTELDGMGGLAAYQHMSNIGQGSDRGGGSEKVLIDWLRKRDLHRGRDIDKFKLLEVGALRPDNYASCSSWMDVEPIDLHARVPGVREQDFLLLDEGENDQAWDAISLSLVLNFVPDANDRGRMLMMCRNFLKSNGLLFVALPLPCVTNSRYLTIDHFKLFTSYIGLRCLEEQWKAGRKMAYFLLERVEDPLRSSAELSLFTKKRELLKGANRNNFCILL